MLRQRDLLSGFTLQPLARYRYQQRSPRHSFRPNLFSFIHQSPITLRQGPSTSHNFWILQFSSKVSTSAMGLGLRKLKSEKDIRGKLRKQPRESEDSSVVSLSLEFSLLPILTRLAEPPSANPLYRSSLTSTLSYPPIGHSYIQQRPFRHPPPSEGRIIYTVPPSSPSSLSVILRTHLLHIPACVLADRPTLAVA